jgi:hypothetical protein
MNTWLIVFFIHEIMEYRSQSNKLLDEIKGFLDDGGGSVKIIVLLDDVELISPSEDYKYTYSIREYSQSEDGIGLTYTEIKPAAIDLSNRNAWKDAFIYIFSHYEAQKRILITWSHGKGFGLDYNTAKELKIEGLSEYSPDNLIETKNTIHFASNSILDQKKISSPDFHAGKIQESDFSSFESSKIMPCGKANIIWIQEIADILSSSLPQHKKLDILMMVNCNMQMIDNGFILKDKVHYLIAPESVFPYYGYNYKRLFNLLRKYPGITNKLLARKITEDFLIKYMYELKAGIDIVQESTIFTNNLKYYDHLLILLNDISETLTIYIKESKEFLIVLSNIRSKSLKDTSKFGLGLVDLGLLLKCLSKSNTPYQYQLKIFYNRYKALARKIIKSKFVGENFTLTDKYDSSKYGIKGVSIYFPKNDKELMLNPVSLCAYYDANTLNQFAKSSTWDNFLQDYLYQLNKIPNQSLS